MKWFKHLSGSLNDNLIFEAIEEFGSDGYLVFFGVLEILADEFDYMNPGILQVSYGKLVKNFQISKKKITKILHFYDKKAKNHSGKNSSFEVDFLDKGVRIRCNRFRDLCDEYTTKIMKQKSGECRESVGRMSALEAEAEAEAEKDLIDLKQNDDFFKKIKPKIETICRLANESNKKFEVGKWVDIQIGNKKNKNAVIDTLDQIIAYWNQIEKSVWKYADTILLTRDQNYNEMDSIRESNHYKEILKNVGGKISN